MMTYYSCLYTGTTMSYWDGSSLCYAGHLQEWWT